MKRILVSDQSINSHGYNVLTAGIDLSRFEGNPIMLFNHQRAFRGKTDDVLPIGVWKDVVQEGDKLYATPVFDETDEFAQRIAKKFEAGVLRSASIGIFIKKMLLDEDADTLSVTESQLQEISIVDIPSNQNAVAIYDEQNEPMSEEAVMALAAGFSTPKPTIQPEMKFEKTINLLGLSADASDEAAALAITTLKSDLDAKTSELKTLKEAESERLTAENEALVEAAFNDKRITADQKPAYLNVLTNDPKNGRTILAGLAPVQTLASIAKGKEDAGGDAGDGKHQGKTYMELADSNPEELNRLEKEDNDAYQRLYNAEFADEIKANKRDALART